MNAESVARLALAHPAVKHTREVFQKFIASSCVVHFKEQMFMAAFVTDLPMISRLALIRIPCEGRRGSRIS